MDITARQKAEKTLDYFVGENPSPTLKDWYAIESEKNWLVSIVKKELRMQRLGGYQLYKILIGKRDERKEKAFIVLAAHTYEFKKYVKKYRDSL
jgi:hypothetical protein